MKFEETIWNWKNRAYRLVHSSLWIQVNRKRDKAFDDLIRKEMADGTLIPSSEGFVAYLSTGQTIWISNYPYGYGNIYNGDSFNDEIRPAIGELTIKELDRYITKCYEDGKVINSSDLVREYVKSDFNTWSQFLPSYFKGLG